MGLVCLAVQCHSCASLGDFLLISAGFSKHNAKAIREARPYLPYVNDIVKKAILLDSNGLDPNKVKSQNSLLMHSMYAVADIGNGPEVLRLYVEEMNNPATEVTSKRAYQLQNIEKAFNASVRVQGNASSSLTNASNAVHTVADLFAAVKTYDSNFSPNPSSKIANADGTPKVMYHGSPAQFTIFGKKKAKSSGLYGRGFYFTDSESQAGVYGNKYAVYLNIRNPLESGKATVDRKQVRKFLEAVAENEDYSIENYGTYDVDVILKQIMGSKGSIDAYKVLNDTRKRWLGPRSTARKAAMTTLKRLNSWVKPCASSSLPRKRKSSGSSLSRCTASSRT